MPANAPTTLENWNRAVDLLGGQRATARLLDCGERTMRGLCSGERDLHDGWLEDISKALLAHADACRALERQISPAFAANRIEEERTSHNWRRDFKPAAKED